MKFAKMHGLGNDFIVMENLSGDLKLKKDQITLLCNRRFGIGADGLILISPSDVANIKMDFYNCDGTQVEMCGNGIRCFAKYVYDNKIVLENPLYIETLAGKKCARLIIKGGKVSQVCVDMGVPIFDSDDLPKIENKAQDLYIDYKGEKIAFSPVSMGNPHVVIFVEDITTYPIKTIGSFIENHPIFPKKTNVNIVQVIDEENLRVVTWERGAGLTLACGTGACASAVISLYKGKTKNKVNAYLPGGKLFLEIKEHIFMTGDANFCFSGEIDL